jgi:hypothetical protein
MVLNPSLLDLARRRRSAGESLKAMAVEFGITWQKLDNALLKADHPEALEPIWKLDGESRRCTGQRYYGVPTRIEWGIEEILMPTMPGSPSSGALIRVPGLTGHIAARCMGGPTAGASGRRW